jgi:hypothetical protein
MIQLSSQAEQEQAVALFKHIMDFLHGHKEEVTSFQHININIYASDDDTDDGQGDYHRVDMKVRTTPFGNEVLGTGKVTR